MQDGLAIAEQLRVVGCIAVTGHLVEGPLNGPEGLVVKDGRSRKGQDRVVDPDVVGTAAGVRVLDEGELVQAGGPIGTDRGCFGYRWNGPVRDVIEIGLARGGVFKDPGWDVFVVVYEKVKTKTAAKRRGAWDGETRS